LATQPSPILRLRPDQRSEAREASIIREDARALRSRVSHGSYGDDELGQFWGLCERAGLALWASSSELGDRAGLGSDFFSSVVRDRRRPKLTNFLKALTAIVEIADERLYEVDRVGRDSTQKSRSKNSRLLTISDCDELLLLACSLARLANDEISRLDDERPNDPVTAAKNKKQRELLVIFANGFDRIAMALTASARHANERQFLAKVREVVDSVSSEINSWWKKNGADAADWGVRLPVFAAGVGMLGWAGANMTIATTAVAAMVGGPKVVEAIRALKKRQ
jgi:hypothetical protein